MNTLPIACALSPDDLRDRKATTLQKLTGSVREVRALPSGYGFRFVASDAVLVRITEVIQHERRCCRFMQFDVQVLPDEGPVWLRITGPDGTKAFLEDLLDLGRLPAAQD